MWCGVNNPWKVYVIYYVVGLWSHEQSSHAGGNALERRSTLSPSLQTVLELEEHYAKRFRQVHNTIVALAAGRGCLLTRFCTLFSSRRLSSAQNKKDHTVAYWMKVVNSLRIN